ncbi:hypothetical protein PSU4_38350 [Pseudonocardia sulfidoxydans NBRC 16205]|uniref:Uncharacterized protein n=1 Tax=Pseudonocardia sulfidoxydans NBRC 16205 TaxID=1223511 RepID=A0A511DJA0_9PSEU|nr:hypothetical protein PSU4_38350 [Pseudonocardia sulfidoxydans NBRC 16205]
MLIPEMLRARRRFDVARNLTAVERAPDSGEVARGCQQSRVGSVTSSDAASVVSRLVLSE